MKILILSHTSDLVGGAERSMLDVFDYWTAKYDIKPEFILREPLGSMVGEMKKRGWKYYPVKFTFWSHPSPTKNNEIFRDSKLNSKAVKKIEKIIKKSKPDIVMTNTLVSPWGAIAAYNQNTPHVWFVREYGDLDHGRHFDISHEETYQDIGNLSNLVVANSETLARHIGRYVDKARVTTLYNPFKLQAIEKQATEKVSSPFKYSGSLKLIMTSNISRSKGQLEAVEATGILNKKGHLAEICIVGKNVDKPYYAAIEDVMNKYGIVDKVHLVGLQPNALAFVKMADVGIVASRKEAFGRTTFEYLAIGKPVLGADSGATPEMVKPDKNGYLFKPGNAVELAEKAENYATNRKLLKNHGEESSKLAVKMMAGEHNIDALYRKVEKIAAGKSEPKAEPINYLTQWLMYQKSSKNHVDQTQEIPFKQRTRSHLRQVAKNNYYRARKVKARLTGK